MVDFSQLLSGMGQPSGLLSPEQSANVNQDFMANLAAGLMKAGGPSPYKAGMTTLSGIGEALQGGLAARRQSQQDAMTQTLVRANTMDKILPFYNLALKYDQAEVPRPKYLQDALDAFSKTIMGGRLPGVGGAPGIGAPGATAGGAAAPLAGGGARVADAGGAPGAPGGDTTGAGPLPKTPKQILAEAGFGPWAGTPEGLNHVAAEDYLKRYMTEHDPEHRRYMQQEELFKNTLPTTMKEIQERKHLGLPITDETVAPLVAAGADKRFIDTLLGGGKATAPAPAPAPGGRPVSVPGVAPPAPSMPPPGTLPPNMAALLGGAGTPSAGGPPSPPPSPSPGPPSMPPPAAAGPPPGPPPQSPLRVAGGGPSLPLPPVGGPTAPPTMPPAAAGGGLPAAPPTAGTPGSPLAPPAGMGLPPSGQTVAGQLGLPADETPAQQMARLHIKPEDLLSSSPRKAWAEEQIKADSAANNKVAQTQKQLEKKWETELADTSAEKKARTEAEIAKQKTVWDARVEHDKKQMPIWASVGANSIATMQNNALSRDLIKDPNFKSGIFGQASETWNAIKAGLGLDPNAAFSQQVFNKVTARNALDSLEGIKDQAAAMESSGAGRVLLQTYTTILKQVQSVGIGESSNIFLSRLSDNLAKQQSHISDMALENKMNSKDGLLDGPKFDKDVIQYLRENPAYTPGDLEKAKAEGKLYRENNERIAAGGPPVMPKYTPEDRARLQSLGAKQADDGGMWITTIDSKGKKVHELQYP